MNYYKGDNLDKKKADGKLVGKYEPWEIERLCNKYNATERQVTNAIGAYGPDMEKVEA